jgi:hypothetical protein
MDYYFTHISKLFSTCPCLRLNTNVGGKSFRSIQKSCHLFEPESQSRRPDRVLRRVEGSSRSELDVQKIHHKGTSHFMASPRLPEPALSLPNGVARNDNSLMIPEQLRFVII